MEEIRKSAKTVDDAIAAALADLGAAREEVDITVIDEVSKGFLRMFGGNDAVVLLKFLVHIETTLPVPETA